MDRVLENWEALILFFTNECFEDNLVASQTILSQLKSPAFKIYFTFLSYILNAVNRLNVEFQAEKPKLQLLLNRVRGLYRSILRNYVRKDYLDNTQLQAVQPSNPRNFITLEDVYFGSKTELLIKSGTIYPKDVHNFRTHALSFYVTLSEQIKNRFNFESPILLFVSHFDPKTVCQGVCMLSLRRLQSCSLHLSTILKNSIMSGGYCLIYLSSIGTKKKVWKNFGRKYLTHRIK